jgi:gluconolactonase
MRGVLRFFVASALVAACSGSNKGDLFGPNPAAADNAAAPSDEEPSATDHTADTDAGTAAKDGSSKHDSSTPPPPPAPAKNPLDDATELTEVKSGYGSLEGPIWRASAKALLFSDLQMDSIQRFAPPSTFATFRYPSGGSNGLALDPQGQLVVCEGKNRKVTRTTTMGTETIASEYQGMQLNAPNDVVVRSDGTVYFTDPDYSVYGTKELSFDGVFRVETNGAIHLIADDMKKPNGIALSPDEKTLYVTDESAGFIRAYDVATDGSTSNARKFVEASHPDGIAVDDDGNLYVAALTGVIVFQPDGSSWGTVTVPHQPANVAFGGAARKTLFITALDTLYQLEVGIPGPP